MLSLEQRAEIGSKHSAKRYLSSYILRDPVQSALHVVASFKLCKALGWMYTSSRRDLLAYQGTMGTTVH